MLQQHLDFHFLAPFPFGEGLGMGLPFFGGTGSYP